MTTRDMTGTVRCAGCFAFAEHERGPGSPLSIRHEPGCLDDPRNQGPRCSDGHLCCADQDAHEHFLMSLYCPACEAVLEQLRMERAS